MNIINPPIALPSNFVDSSQYSGALTDDTLLDYCQSRINGIDAQVDTEFNNQKHIQDATSTVNTVQSLFAQANANGGKGMVQGQVGTIIADLQSTIAELGPNDPRTQQLQVQLDTLSTTYNNNIHNDASAFVIDPQLAGKFADTFGSISKDLSSDAEMQMMTLQSLITQRQTAVQMCTNMLSSMGDTEKAIAEKLGS